MPLTMKDGRVSPPHSHGAPNAVLNLGTCGGVARDIEPGDIVPATRTLQYDVLQKFGKPTGKFRRSLEVALDLSWVASTGCAPKLREDPSASADQDLDHAQREALRIKGVPAADWESASIATVCALNKVRCLILRGVSDVPAHPGTAGRNVQELDYERNTPIILISS